MGKKALANEDVEVEASENGAHTAGTLNLTLNKSQKNFAGTDKALISVIIAVSPSGCSMSGYSFITGVGTIQADAEKCFDDNVGVKKFFKKDCKGSCNGTHIQTSYPFSTYSCSCDLSVKDAGQDKVEGA